MYVDKFINTHGRFFIFFISLPTKRNLFAIQLLIYIIYGDRTIMGFDDFVANLLNRPTDDATVSVLKKVIFRSLVSM
jgi:hypothetical protein